MPEVMLREPVAVPRRPGVYALVNKKRRLAYVAFSTDLQKRSHSLAHMLQNPKTHWSIKDLPRHPAGEFTFSVIAEGVAEKNAARYISAAEREIADKNYRLVLGSRGAVPLVNFKGEQMPLTDAIEKAKCKAKYITVWRRIDRGWSVEQALGLEPPPVRWDPAAAAQRRKRARQRQRNNGKTTAK
jgi:hypothetical protein